MAGAQLATYIPSWAQPHRLVELELEFWILESLLLLFGFGQAEEFQSSNLGQLRKY